MFRSKMIMTNATLLSMSTTEQIYYISILKRLSIVFGSICSLWLIMGLIFLLIQTYQRLQTRRKQKFSRLNRSLSPPVEQIINADPISDDDDDDDQTSVFTSVSFLSDRSKSNHLHRQFLPPCERIPEETLEFNLPIVPGISNMAYSQSTLTSMNDGGLSFLYYPACRNFAFSQSTLASSMDLNTPTPSIIVPSSPNHPQRHSSQSSTTTASSQITNETSLSLNHRMTSVKTMPLPTVMITDCDRLQTDIIELEDFQPENDWRRARPELRLLLNERMPQTVR